MEESRMDGNVGLSCVKLSRAVEMVERRFKMKESGRDSQIPVEAKRRKREKGTERERREGSKQKK
jgi:hypothetical protein